MAEVDTRISIFSTTLNAWAYVVDSEGMDYIAEDLCSFEGDLIAVGLNSIVNKGRVSRFTAGGRVEIDGTGALDGVDGADLRACAVYKDELIVAGKVDSINGVGGGNNVFKFDGVWAPFGLGLVNGVVNDLFVNPFDSKLYAIGDFDENGDGDTVKGLAVWNVKEDKFEQVGDNTGLTTAVGFALWSFQGKLDGKLP